ncbi:MAG: (Fe-S)-binding protein [Bacteroidetes bacterium]|nr:(Fe-S)-binding protein [Bacteroidota bacterium]
MQYLPNVLFAVLLIVTTVLFAKQASKIRRNILLGRDLDRSDNPKLRWKTMFMVALGQSKMVKRPVAGLLHIVVYAGFVIINIEVIEILIDGLFSSHRALSFMGPLYDFLIGSFEILAIMVLAACLIFLIRRNVLKIKRFWQREMTSWPRSDANIILITEVLLMSAFLIMNVSDSILQERMVDHFTKVGAFPVSSMFVPLFDGLSSDSLIFIERFCWWFHIVGIFAFINYLPYSKHFHIILAFPNVYYSNLEKLGRFTNITAVTNEVKLMMDPTATPPPADAAPQTFGAKDISDLTWKSIMDGYTCTECGRCSSVCPANQTGKLLSPRKIMMDVRDRAEEVGQNIDKHGKDHNDGKTLVYDYITPEELWACTSCNACTDACPVNNDPLAVIVELRRYLVMEKSEAPKELNNVFTNIENNGAPWQFPMADRLNWAKEQE